MTPQPVIPPSFNADKIVEIGDGRESKLKSEMIWRLECDGNVHTITFNHGLGGGDPVFAPKYKVNGEKVSDYIDDFLHATLSGNSGIYLDSARCGINKDGKILLWLNIRGGFYEEDSRYPKDEENPILRHEIKIVGEHIRAYFVRSFDGKRVIVKTDNSFCRHGPECPPVWSWHDELNEKVRKMKEGKAKIKKLEEKEGKK